MKSNEDVTVENKGKFQKIAKYDTGAMFVSSDGQYAIAIIEGKLKVGRRDKSVENKVGPDGWLWVGAFGAGEGDLSELYTGYIYTNLVTILSSKGNLGIKDNMITIFDGSGNPDFADIIKSGGSAKPNGKVRCRIGYDERIRKYVFEIYNENEEKTIYMDEDGEAIFAGNIDTKKSVKVGEQIYLRDKSGNEYAALYAGVGLVHPNEQALQMRAYNVDIHATGDVLRLRGKKEVSIGTVSEAGKVMINGEEVATIVDIKGLNGRIKALENKINNPTTIL